MVDLLCSGMGGAMSGEGEREQNVVELGVGCDWVIGEIGRVGELWRKSAMRSWVDGDCDLRWERGMVRQVDGGERLTTSRIMAWISGVEGRRVGGVPGSVGEVAGCEVDVAFLVRSLLGLDAGP
jgi:hypothetical protein